MSEGNLRLNPLQAKVLKWKSPEERRTQPQWMHRRTNVVAESGPRQGHGSSAASDGFAPLDDLDRSASLGKRYRSRQTIGPGSDNHGIKLRHMGSTFTRDRFWLICSGGTFWPVDRYGHVTWAAT
jgi:hypothetical protein